MIASVGLDCGLGVFDAVIPEEFGAVSFEIRRNDSASDVLG